MDINEAVIKAKQECLGIFSPETPKDIRLEEILLDDANNWIVTLSYLREHIAPESDELYVEVKKESFFSNDRMYKVMTIKKSNGEVIAIKNRDLTW